MKMDKLGEEVSDKIKCAVRAKLTELGIHIDNELPDYVMVLVANKKSQQQMEEDLRLFLGDSTVSFTNWLYEILKKLERFTISSKGTKRKVDEKKSKHKKSSSESDNTSTSKKVKLKIENTSFGKMAESYFDLEDISNSNEGFDAMAGRMEEKVRADLSQDQPKLTVYTDDEQMTAGDDDDAIQLHDNNEADYIPDRPASSLEETLLPDAKHLDFTEKLDKYNGDKEDVKPREKIKICWDNNSAENKRKSDGKEDINLTCNKNKNNNESKELEYNKNEINTKSSIRVNEFGDSESSVREKNEYIGNKIVDARDILKKKSSLSLKVSRNESKVGKNRHSRRSRDKGSKENYSRCLSSVSKPVKREPEKPTVPSLVKVTPRPVRPPGMQPSCNLILKAVADAEKSVASTKLTQKKVQTKNEPKEKKEKEKKSENYVRSRRENISITLLNDRVVSSDIEETVKKQKDFEEYEPTDPAEGIQLETSPPPEIVENKNESISSGSNGFQHLPSNEELQLQLQEPRFIITLDSTASDTEMEGELEVSVDNENCEESSNKETLSVVRQPFDRSRLGPRLGPPVNDEIGGEYRLYTIDEGNDSSQDVEMETTEVSSENGKSQTRCKYWPCCDAGNTCPYYHPTMLCRLFPACHYGDKCLYIHPACKFADKCMNINCPFAHTSATPGIGKVFKTPLPLSTTNGQMCMYYPHCTKPFCPYLHIKKPCKFGSSCTKHGCEFEHPNRTITKNPYKWVANQ